MDPSMDHRRILAGIERHLAREDPGLVSLMDALNHQFPHEPDDADDLNDNSGRYDLCRRVIVTLIIAALAGLFLAALFAKPPPVDDDQEPPAKALTPAVAVHARRHGPWARTGTGPAPPARRVSATGLPRRGTHACT